MTITLEAPARMRAKNQVTVPEPVVSALEAQPGDTLIFEADATEPGVIHVRLLPRTFAAALSGTYGTSTEVVAFLRREHADWE